MRQASALTQPEDLLRLIARLEPQGHLLPHIETDEICGGVVIPSPIDPGASVAFLVAVKAPSARAAAERRWWAENRHVVEEILSRRSVSDVTVIFPGAWPERIWRGGTDRNMRVRLVSAVYHLWVDRLKRHNDEGDLDENAREKLVTKLGGEISAADERRYTPPSLYPAVAESPQTEEARSGLLAEPADPLAGLTVLFGPGGIGKSFFLRRLTARLARQSIKDPTSGIPVYAELPLLLHTDALETWLSAQGLRLPLDAIRTLIEEGVVVPVLDALDELVRGQAREGSRQFLSHLKQTVGEHARGVLSSRDYYLNLDPLVPSELGDKAQYLTVGFFDRPGRRRYVQVRTGLSGDHASRWANQLEGQAGEALVGATDKEIEALIGHPLFLDAFCQMITDIPEERRATEADGFQLRSPDIFGEIVDRVLRREHMEKFLPAWESQGLGRQLMEPWNDPFTPELQRRVLRELVLKAAYDGGAEALRRGADDPRYRRLRHGLFTFSRGILLTGEIVKAPDVLGGIVQEVLGLPEPMPHVPESEAETARTQAVQDLVGAFRSHTLADTQPDQPDTLVFATRHRAYFDYILAAAVLQELIESLRRGAVGIDENFVLWCLDHNIIEHGERGEAPPFASCLDFILWHRDAVDIAASAAESYLGPPTDSMAFSEELASYVCSLGVALLLRYGQRRGSVELVGFDAASHRECTIRILPDIVPAASGLHFETCMFPTLVLREVDLKEIRIVDSEFRSLQVGDSSWRDVYVSAEIGSLSFHGRVDLQGCVLDIRGDAAASADIEWAPTTKVTLRQCRLSEVLFLRLQEQAKVSGGVLQLQECEPIKESSVIQYSSGRRFVNRLINLCRKDGHEQYGVFRSKLRGLSPATSYSFAALLDVLAKRGVIISANDTMICLTKLAEKQRFSGKAVPGQRSYEEVSEFWDPIVEELDEAFGSGT
jgi:hypothetical protein